MNIIIFGCDRLGSILANELSDAGQNVTVVDRDGDRLNVLGSGFNGLKIKGIEYDEDVLKEAEISSSDAVLAVTPDENINITVSLIAKEIFKVPRIIARIVNPNREYIYEELGIETISPTRLSVDILEEKLLVSHPVVLTAINGDYEIAQAAVGRGKCFTVKELEDRFGCRVSAIVRGESLVYPDGTEVVAQGDKIICIAGKSNIKKLVSALKGAVHI